MKKKIISDIRLFKSESQNEFGDYITDSFGDKKLNAIVTRLVMKLRENEFSLGEFDHLYINFTTCDIAENIKLSVKEDRYHPWYRYCNVHVEKDLFQKLGSPETWNDIIHWIGTILATHFASDDFDKAHILACINQAVVQSESMLVKFKEKVGTKRKAVIFLRFLDSCKFYPLLRVYDTEDNLLFETDLPQTVMLDYLGDIQVSAKRVTVKPRKNAFTAKNNPLVFEY
ncbi:MAG: hypothetical protein IJN56_02045 [Clostridia bacterium]|nr:hypothetical protein [Clostridia bacterium]